MSFIPRLFLPLVAEGQTELELDESVSRYLVKVLRLSEGARFLGFDSQAFQYELLLKKADPHKSVASILAKNEKSAAFSRSTIALAQGLPKASKMDLILRQGTEVGIHRFIPLVTQRSISRPNPEQFDHKNDRWQKILVEACRQCGRADVPALDPVTDWKNGVKLFSQFDLVLLPYEKEAPTLKTVLESYSPALKILVLVGPEGGWTKEEVGEAEEKGAYSVHLPTPILRTETAGVVIVSMIRYFFSQLPGDNS
jgi:16S rRNA (uracil1498-N3)-methyltransferase